RLRDALTDAARLYEGALAEDEFDVDYLNNLSVIYRLVKRYDEAIAALRKLLSRTPKNAEAYKNLGLIYLDQDNVRLAEFVLAEARKLDEEDAGVFNNLGLIALRNGDRRQAMGLFARAVELDED